MYTIVQNTYKEKDDFNFMSLNLISEDSEKQYSNIFKDCENGLNLDNFNKIFNLNVASDKSINSVDIASKKNIEYKDNDSLLWGKNDISENFPQDEGNCLFDDNNSDYIDKSLLLNDLGDVNTADRTGKKKFTETKKQEIKEENIKNEPSKIKLQIEIPKEIKEEKNTSELPHHYLFDEIKNKIFPKMEKDIYDIIIDSYKYSDSLKAVEKKMSDETFKAPKKRNRDKEKKETEPKKLGRKKKNDESNRDHNKNSEDNIIKKIKAKVIACLLKFINGIINSSFGQEKVKLYVRTIKNIKSDKEPEKEDLIKDLNYQKTVNETKKGKNLYFFELKLKDFLSIEISPKFSTYECLSNKKIINEIIKNEQENRILMFILNDLTFEDYIDIYTRKRDLNSFKQFDENELDFIKKQFIYVDALLEEVHKINNENNYFSHFVSILYNIKRWFIIKQERKKKR